MAEVKDSKTVVVVPTVQGNDAPKRAITGSFKQQSCGAKVWSQFKALTVKNAE
mgnify:FL=1|tara:strand:- start:26 stop:184 length:159 start_codon:yes stop_codon:yes gene_type:complete